MREVSRRCRHFVTARRRKRCAGPVKCAPRYNSGCIGEVFDQGLHEYLTRFLDRIDALATQIQTSFFGGGERPA